MRIRVPQALARPVRGKIGKFWGCEGVCGKFRRIRGGVADLVHGGAGFS
ncbi:hypothetical protein HMPREF9278_2132 [Mobiluncus mulieris FB024-16]|nr:hypothetical protein HMPREF9278_2132 [Mobiluncus mulieris FB024-16]